VHLGVLCCQHEASRRLLFSWSLGLHFGPNHLALFWAPFWALFGALENPPRVKRHRMRCCFVVAVGVGVGVVGVVVVVVVVDVVVVDVVVVVVVVVLIVVVVFVV
jgi:hypothetical protein